MNRNNLGLHILIEYYDCDMNLLKNASFIEKIMLEAAKIANTTVVESVFHEFSPWGVSGVTVIEESHLTIHTWPEYNYAAVDLFTCGDENVDPLAAFEYLKQEIKAQRWEYQEIARGQMFKVKPKK